MNRFDKLATPHIRSLFIMAFHLCGNREDAEDIVQDVFLKAQKSFHTLKNPDKCKSWLCSILYRHFIDECRKKRYFVELGDHMAPTVEEPESDWPETITHEDLTKSLNKLDPKYRLPLVAHFLSGQSYKEISQSLDLPMGTVMSRIHRAKNLMRTHLTRSAKSSTLRIVKGSHNGV